MDEAKRERRGSAGEGESDGLAQKLKATCGATKQETRQKWRGSTTADSVIINLN